MPLAHVHARWIVFRTFGALGSVAGETPLHEPVVVIEDDRLVLRNRDGRFWSAVTCPSCGAELADIDLPAHLDVCTGATSRRSLGGAKVEVPRRRVPVDVAAGIASLRRPDLRQNRSSARVFGRTRPRPAGELLLLVAALLASLVVMVMALGALSR